MSLSSSYCLLCFILKPQKGEKARARTGNMPKIVPLNDLNQHIGNIVNLVGNVVEFAIPKKSNGSDFTMSLKIVDESLTEISVSLFMQNADLPVIKAPGDVIYLYSVKVDEYKQTPCIVFRKWKSRYKLYSVSALGDFQPYLPHPPSRLAGLINKEIERLRLWYHNFQPNTGTSEYLLLIKELEPKMAFDVVCKVLHIRKDDHKMFIYLWDGTDAPTQNINKKYDGHVDPLPMNNNFDSLTQTLLQSFPQPGTVLRVEINVDHGNFVQHFHFNDKWVRLRNLYSETFHGMWQISSKTLKIRVLPSTDPVIQELDRIFMQRKAEKDCMPMSYDPLAAQLTEIVPPKNADGDWYRLSTLLDVVAATPVVDTLFKCIVRMVDVYPSEDNIQFMLTLEDTTTRIHVYTPEVEGVHIWSSEDSGYDFMIKFKKLIGMGENHQESYPLSPPWFPCIIRALPSTDGGSTTYHLVHTRLTLTE